MASGCSGVERRAFISREDSVVAVRANAGNCVSGANDPHQCQQRYRAQWNGCAERAFQEEQGVRIGGGGGHIACGTRSLQTERTEPTIKNTAEGQAHALPVTNAARKDVDRYAEHEQPSDEQALVRRFHGAEL
ncbi:hypothetical protein GCM10009304_11580 [Pseudomonas matsuisoli]|uniref:Uncharacterized protein n=1 Tax=Pseudomonas matsuisoli TaxID=1515666 RepID=A0A917UV30_9PSED|nr:hypothetical protein GCM10009304_11580 [Pseudomonas matsuisoli]